MGIDEEKVDEIIAMHTETVEGLKADIAKYKEDAEKLPTVQKELDALKAAGDGGLQERFDALQREYDEFKGEVTAKEAKAAKERAARAFFEGKGITGKSLDIAIRGCGAEIDALELEDGKIKDDTALDALVKDTYSGLVSTTVTRGAQTANPPVNNGAAKTKEQIMGIKDTAERQREIAQNLDLFQANE